MPTSEPAPDRSGEEEEEVGVVVPVAEDVDGDWCYTSGTMIGQCFTVVGNTLSWDDGFMESLEFWSMNGECFEFTVGASSESVGSYALIYCPAQAATPSDLSDTDAPGEDRIFSGQGYPAELAQRV